MAELHESSGLHSLVALREHEKRQIQLKAEAARARAEAEQRSRLESEREAARAESERARAERAALESATAERQAELTRLEAARVAEVARAERARREGEELRVLLGEERSARRAAELAFAARLIRQRLFTVTSIAVCLATWLGAAAFYFGAVEPRAERTQLESDRALADARRARTVADANAARVSHHSDELALRVRALEQVARDASAPTPSSDVPRAPTQKTQIMPKIVSVSRLPCRDDGDPLNPCLKH